LVVRSGNQSGEQTRSFIERARRDQIVRAAIDTIAEVGYAKASIKEIAQRAGISGGLISYHFAGKDELLHQVVADIRAALDQSIGERAGDATSYAAGLRALLAGFVHFCAEHRTDMYALREIAANSAKPDLDDSIDELAEMLREGQEAGEFREFDPRLMAVSLNAALEAVPRELYARADTDVTTYADELAEAFVQAVRRKGKRRG
jgi:TetR/AcrR family fatty acid metabolism transcriptional regulator